MRKLTALFILIAIPLFVLANGFGFNHRSFDKTPLMQNDRSYRLTERNTFTWDDVNLAWSSQMNNVYHYPANNPTRPDSITVNYWNSATNSYMRIGVYLIDYNTTGDLVTHINMYMNMGLQGVIHYQEMNYAYSPQGYLTGYDMSMYNTQTGVMSVFGWMKIQYVSTSNYQSWSWSSQNDQNIPLWDHTTFAWDAQGRIITETTQTSPDSLNWANEYQVTHEYQSNDTTTGTQFVYNLSHQLPLAMTGDYNGPFFGYQIQSITSGWTGNWVNETKDTWTYDANHILTSDLQYRWLSSYWSEDWRNEYTYDNNHNLIEDIYANMGSVWVNENKTTFVWSSGTGNSDDAITPTAQILNAYPNPALQTGTVTFETKLAANEQGKLAIYNLKGQLVKSFAINAKTASLKWNNRDNNNQACAAGIYFYSLNTNNQHETRKLVIIK
jgi:hypothetical protein